MSDPISFEKPEFHLIASDGEAHASHTPDTPFRIALLGDFSGRENSGTRADATHAGRRIFEIDRDNFDEVMSTLGVGLRLRLGAGDASGGGATVALRFRELEDFHPDRVCERLDIFRSLRETRRRLGDPSTFDAAAAEVRSWAGVGSDAAGREREQAGPSEPRHAPGAEATSGRDLIERMLNRAEVAEPEADATAAVRPGPSPSSARPAELSDFGRFLSDVVKPHLVSVDEARKADLTNAVDAAATHLMRAVLHHPDFQSLEAAWRAAHFLVSRAETGAGLKLFLLDLTRGELAAGLRVDAAAGGVRIEQLLDEQRAADAPDAEPWALLVGNYTFDHTADDAELLGLVADFARRAGAPFVASASARVAGLEPLAGLDDEERPRGDAEAGRAWAELRRRPGARYLGLVAPRFLLRLPYGAETEPAESFDFEEMSGEGGPRHEDYLWGNPAHAVACLLAEGFGRAGWEMRAGDVKEIEGLPLHVYEERGETLTKPCAEVLLTERDAGEMLGRGVMPLLSFRNRDAVRLARFQSLASPASALSGRWL